MSIFIKSSNKQTDKGARGGVGGGTKALVIGRMKMPEMGKGLIYIPNIKDVDLVQYCKPC